jgi:hypothetical protein
MDEEYRLSVTQNIYHSTIYTVANELNEWILYLQKAYTCYSNQTDIYTCNTMTKSREQLNTLYIDNNIN